MAKEYALTKEQVISAPLLAGDKNPRQANTKKEKNIINVSSLLAFSCKMLYIMQ